MTQCGCGDTTSLAISLGVENLLNLMDLSSRSSPLIIMCFVVVIYLLKLVNFIIITTARSELNK